jgi:hypothetical protein
MRKGVTCLTISIPILDDNKINASFLSLSYVSIYFFIILHVFTPLVIYAVEDFKPHSG